MIELSVNSLVKYYGANKIFENISFEVQTGERIGLIGQNGCGKTTVMKILMGVVDYQGGSFSLRKGNRMGYLNQIPNFEDTTTALDVLQMAFQSLSKLKYQMEELEQQMGLSEGEQLDKAIQKYSRLQEQYEREGGYETEIKLNKISEGLNISESMKELKFNDLSGGEKTRVMLAKILLEEPDILLLDEPTNHLDLVMIEWLEEFLSGYRGTVLMISHDRYFLDLVVTKVIELESDHAEIYQGNYSYYVLEKERRLLIALRNYQNQQKKIERMEQQIERYRIWGAMRDSEEMFKRAKVLEKRLEKIDAVKRPVINKRKLCLDPVMAGRSGRIVVEGMGLTKRFGSKILFQKADIHVFYQDSICIIGENGSGKTTLLRTILGETEPDEGIIKTGSQVCVGYLPQQVEFPDEDQTILEYFTAYHNITNGEARSQLAKAMFFREAVNKKLKYLSGGEKSRLKLCSLTFKGVNFLILDEPTNHLDIESREVLEETLEDFTGTIIFVSHDRYFINKLASKIIVLDHSRIKEFNGDYFYYIEKRREEGELAASKIKENNHPVIITEHVNKIEHVNKTEHVNITEHVNKTENVNKKENVNKTEHVNKTELLNKTGTVLANNSQVHTKTRDKKFDYQSEKLENLIDHMEEQMRQLDEMMVLNGTDIERLNELYTNRELCKTQLDQAYEQWESLQYNL